MDIFKELEEREKNRTRWEKFVDFFWRPYHRLSNFLWYYKPKFLYQRITRGFSDDAVWSLDHHLSGLIAPRLRELAKNIHGCPHEYAEKYHNAEQGCIHWRHDIKKMAFAFEKIEADDWEECWKFFDKFRKTENDEDRDMWIFVRKLRTEYIQKQVDHFAKYFRNLWD